MEDGVLPKNNKITVVLPNVKTQVPTCRVHYNFASSQWYEISSHQKGTGKNIL